MKKTTWLYLPLVILFALAATVLTLHATRVVTVLGYNLNAANLPRSPVISRGDGTISELRAEGEIAGIQTGERVVAVGGRELKNDTEYFEGLVKAGIGGTVNLTVERRAADGQAVRRDVSVTLVRADTTTAQIAGRVAIGVLYLLSLPLISFLLGFWVVFVRPRDPLAWILLFLLLGIGGFGLEGAPTGSLVQTFRAMTFSTWGIAALLFGIYFPERWIVDRKVPWAKWVLIAPLAVDALFTIASQAARFFGYAELGRQIYAPVSVFGVIFVIATITSISIFFAAIGYKSGTVENKDARRRLRILNIGTTLAMLPPFIIILISIFSGNRGSFFDVVPAWFAVLALFSMLLFPLTMAYVIVVERAMNVSVVVRQGLQYALARNGVLVLRIFLSIVVVLTLLFLVRNSGGNDWLELGLVVLGVAAIVLIGIVANRLRNWTDRRFFREAYNAEQILSDLSEEVRTMVETKPLLETVSNKISASLHVPQVAMLLRHGDGFQPAYALGFPSDAPPVNFDEQAATIEKLRKNEPVTIYADDEESWVNATPNLESERENLARLNSQLLLPVGAKEKLSGFLSLSPKRSEEPYTPSDLRLLKSVAAQTGLALENSRLTEAIAAEAAQRERLNREVEIAREVQERLFPQDLPRVKGLDYFGGCRPALGVGGDYYDFFELENGKFGIAIGDVSGKGIGASLMMASLQATLRGQALHFDEDLAALMANVNRLVYETSTTNRYATFFYAQFDPNTRKLTYVNAGHNAPFLFRKTGGDYELLRLEEGGAVVGMLPPMLVNYSQGEIEMQPQDLLIGFTDGISEAMNPQDEEWEEPRMIAAIRAKIDLPASDMFKYLVEQADAFADGAKQHDDMTAIIVRAV